jgi:uncharacterized membrane protein YfcA
MLRGAPMQLKIWRGVLMTCRGPSSRFTFVLKNPNFRAKLVFSHYLVIKKFFDSPSRHFNFFAGAPGGAMNAAAGGGSFIAFPTLLFTGVAPIPANATNTLSLWLGTAASGGAYRHRLNISRRVMIPLLIMSAISGFAEALLLIRTPAQTFLRLIPWLMLAATLLFAFGRRLTGKISGGIAHDASRQSQEPLFSS